MIRRVIKESVDATDAIDYKKLDGGAYVVVKSVPQKLNFTVNSDQWYAIRWMNGARDVISCVTLDSPWMFSTYDDILDTAITGGGNAVLATNLSTGDTPISEPKKIEDIIDSLKEWIEMGALGEEDPLATWSFVTLTGFDSVNNDLFEKI